MTNQERLRALALMLIRERTTTISQLWKARIATPAQQNVVSQIAYRVVSTVTQAQLPAVAEAGEALHQRLTSDAGLHPRRTAMAR